MLLGNYSVLHKSPAKFMSGTTLSGDRANWNKAGSQRSMLSASETANARWKLAAIPQGHRLGGAWMLPTTAGGMTSRRMAQISLSASGSGALGRNLVGTAGISLGGAGNGGIVAGAVGSATISINATGSITAIIAASGSATISMGGSANPGAIGWLSGQATLRLDGTLVSYAVGHMVGTTEDQGLTVAGIANAIGRRIIEAGFSMDDILRLLVAHAAGDATGLEGAAPAFKSLDGTKTRIAGTLAAGERTITSRDAA